MQAEQVESSLGVRRSLVCEPSSWKLQWEKGAFNTYVEKKKRPMWAAAGDPVSNSSTALLKFILSDCLPPLTARMFLGSL